MITLETPDFNKIPMFTNCNGWGCSFSLDMIPKQINDFVTNSGLILNPDFQRGNVWTDFQRTAYLEFFLRRGKTGRDIYFNHPYWQTGRQCKPGDFVLVDGLQRITTILMFTKDKIKAFGYKYSEFAGSPSITDHRLIFWVNELQTRKEVLTWYLEMNTGGSVHTEDEINKVKELLKKEK